MRVMYMTMKHLKNYIANTIEFIQHYHWYAYGFISGVLCVSYPIIGILSIPFFICIGLTMDVL